mgnify:CR=1 FL=1
MARALRHLPYLLRRTVAQAWHDRVLGRAAEAAFGQRRSLPSLCLALVATLGYVSRWFGENAVNRAEHQIESSFGRALSHQVSDQVIAPMLHEVLHGGRADIISIGFVLALWAGSSATATFVNTITIAYGMRDLRGAVRSRLLALWLFLGSVLFGVIVLPMLVLGPQFLKHTFPDRWQPMVARVLSIGYYPVLVGLLFVDSGSGLNLMTAGIILAIMVLPFIASITRDVFLTVPVLLRESAYGMGMTTWEVSRSIVIPYTRVGLVGGVMLGLGRALGETMAVTFVIGNSHKIVASILAPATTISATIANEFTEATGDIYTSSLIALGLILFIITFAVLAVAKWLLVHTAVK